MGWLKISVAVLEKPRWPIQLLGVVSTRSQA
jgi:hypothetical protein